MKVNNKIKRVLTTALSVAVIGSTLFGSQVSTYAGENAYSNDARTSADSLDFSSQELLVKTDSENDLSSKNVVSEYDGLYLLSYDTVSETKKAYMSLYDSDADFVAPNTEFSVAGEVSEEETEEVSEETVEALTEEVTTEEETEVAVPVTEEQESVNNPVSNYEEALENDSVNEAIDEAVKSDKIIALIDTGISADSDVIASVSMTGDDLYDDNGHGTLMLSYIREINPDAKVVSVKAMDSNGKGDAASIYTAVEYAIEQDADIINLSLYGKYTENNAAIVSALSDAESKGITVVGAAGNDGADAKDYLPASIESVLAVGACDENGERLSSSNYGDAVDYNVVSGSTSEATAKMSGFISLYGTEGIADALNKGLIFATDYVAEEQEESTEQEETTEEEQETEKITKDDIYENVDGFTIASMTVPLGTIQTGGSSTDLTTTLNSVPAANILDKIGSASSYYTLANFNTENITDIESTLSYTLSDSAYGTAGEYELTLTSPETKTLYHNSTGNAHTYNNGLWLVRKNNESISGIKALGFTKFKYVQNYFTDLTSKSMDSATLQLEGEVSFIITDAVKDSSGNLHDMKMTLSDINICPYYIYNNGTGKLLDSTGVYDPLCLIHGEDLTFGMASAEYGIYYTVKMEIPDAESTDVLCWGMSDIDGTGIYYDSSSSSFKSITTDWSGYNKYYRAKNFHEGLTFNTGFNNVYRFSNSSTNLFFGSNASTSSTSNPDRVYENIERTNTVNADLTCASVLCLTNAQSSSYIWSGSSCASKIYDITASFDSYTQTIKVRYQNADGSWPSSYVHEYSVTRLYGDSYEPDFTPTGSPTYGAYTWGTTAGSGTTASGHVNPKGGTTVSSGTKVPFSVSSVTSDNTWYIDVPRNVYTITGTTTHGTMTYSINDEDKGTLAASDSDTAKGDEYEVIAGNSSSIVSTRQDDNYYLKSAKKDGTAQTLTNAQINGTGTYEFSFSNITANHTAETVYAKKPTVTVTVQKGKDTPSINGTTTTTGNYALNSTTASTTLTSTKSEFTSDYGTGNDVTVTMTPSNDKMTIKYLEIDGQQVDVTKEMETGCDWVFEDITADHTVVVRFDYYAVDEPYNLTVNYVDAYTGEIISTPVKNKTYVFKDTVDYTADYKTTVSGVEYTYLNRAITINGKVNTGYDISYDLAESELTQKLSGNIWTGTISGNMPETNVTITYYYGKTHDIHIIHKDSNGRVIGIEDDDHVYEGEAYTTEPLDFAGEYTYSKVDSCTDTSATVTQSTGLVSGTMGTDDITIVYIYDNTDKGWFTDDYVRENKFTVSSNPDDWN